MNIIQFNIAKNPHHHRQFCTVLDNIYLKHTGRDISEGLANDLISITHNNKIVQAGIDKDIQKAGIREIYFPNQSDFSTEYNEEINEEVFLLFDGVGINYLHFFFDFFGRCLYFDILKQNNSKLKIGLAEEFWEDTGKNNFIKQWLKLYYGDIDVVVFKKNKRYKIKTIYLPNCLYWSPESSGHQPIMDLIKQTASKVPPIKVRANGCYISRQDTIKHGWYHKREMANELELIDQIKSKLGYDIIELMNYDLIGKIQIFKSYKNIIQQSSASNVNILFSTSKNTNIILSNPKMGPWLNAKCSDYSLTSGCALFTIDDVGELVIDPTQPPLADANNYPWRITDIDGVIDLLKQVDEQSV